MKTLLPLIIRLFAGKISALIASAVLYGVLWTVAHVAALNPQIAAMIDPQATANWVFALIIAILNAATNKYHLDWMDSLSDHMKSQGVSIPVQRAQTAGKS